MGLLRLLIYGALIGMFAANAEPQSARVLPPPRAGLLPVHAPDTDGLEAEVREQLLRVENSAAVLASARATSDQRLSEAYGLLGQVYETYSLTAPAEQSFQNAHRLAPSDFRWVHFLGVICQQGSRTQEAINYYGLVRRLRPDYLAATVYLGNLYFQQNRLEEARTSFTEALAINRSCTAARYGLGQVAVSSRRYAEAVEYLEQALAEAPEAGRIHYALAMAYRGLGNLDKAQAHIQRQGPVGIRVTDPLVDGLSELIRGERLRLARGKIAFEASRFAEAADEFRKAVDSRPDSVPARLNLGSALAQLGQIQGAVEQYREALRIDPKNTTAHYNLGLLLAKQNVHDQAILHLRSALALKPTDGDARYLLARELLKVRREEEALAEFSRVVESDPGNEEALLEEVSLLMKEKQYRQAVERLGRIHALFPERGRTAVLLAYVLASCPQYDLRDGAKALELARLAYQATGLVNHGAIVAMALAELGRCEEAAQWQRRMIDAAERERKTDLAAKLKPDLERYDKARPCRPQGDASGAILPSR